MNQATVIENLAAMIEQSIADAKAAQDNGDEFEAIKHGARYSSLCEAFYMAWKMEQGR